MIRNNVKLYGEADKLTLYAANLAYYLRPPNASEAIKFASMANKMVLALRDRFIANLNSRPDAGPGTIERKRRNYTISQLRDIAKKYDTHFMYEHMKRNVWKP